MTSPSPFRIPFVVLVLAVCFLLSLPASAADSDGTRARSAQQPPPDTRNSHYTGNRPPLRPKPLVKLPIGNIEPRGWLRNQLEFQADGMVRHMEELSRWVSPDDTAWMNPDGQGNHQWEEVPYWLRGYGDLAYVLDNEDMIREAETWLDAAMDSQTESGWFGPRGNKTRSDGKPDLWPNMIMLNALQSYYEYSGDERVLAVMTDYFRWQMQVPDEDFLPPFWQRQRAGDNLESVYWLYNRTGDQWLLDLADKIHRNMARWDEKVASWHGVNITQCFREPAIYWMQQKDDALLRATKQNYRKVIGRYGQQPGGMFGADENAREGYHGPRQAAETCSMVEFMHSFEMLTKITGNTTWADRCEEVAFNSYPASMTPDARGLHYLTAPNMVRLDHENKSPGLQNGGCMLAYSPHERYRCCQHNYAHGWPYYAEELWHATSDDGLAASLYVASAVTAKVGDGTRVTVEEQTRYPFDDTIEFSVEPQAPVQFPLYLRIPGWCESAEARVNGRRLDASPAGGSYLVIEREWRPGDTVTLYLPMEIRATIWDKEYENSITEPNGSVSVSRGPLTYSLRIGQKWVKNGGTTTWPEYDVVPTTDWNYGLVIDPQNPSETIKVKDRKEKLAEQPFTLRNSPITLQAKAKKIPNWQADSLGLVGKMQENPVRSDQPTETVTLVPMGCARLRISAFPRIGSRPDAHEWKVRDRVRFSHCFGGDTPAALNDGIVPDSSGDQSIPRFTWWNHRGTTEWVEYRFGEDTEISSSAVYWFDDRGQGQCRVPESWELLYLEDGEWTPVEGVESYGTQRDRFNEVEFESVKTKAVRLRAQLRPEYSGGILEWRVDGAE